jgi:ABC-type transporter Mla maintaining outer membrane lipid asymmetry ATPase subunit MlaF
VVQAGLNGNPRAADTNFVVLRSGKLYFQGTPPELAAAPDAYLRRFLA